MGSNASTLLSKEPSKLVYHSVTQQSSVVVFQLKNKVWQKLEEILFHEKEYENGFGDWVSINADGTIIAFGSKDTQEYKYTDDGKDLYAGYINTFRLSKDKKWKQLGNKLQGDGGDIFGIRFSLNGKGDKIVVTGNGYDPDDGPANMNYAYHFSIKDSVWKKTGKKIKLEAAYEGYDLSISLNDEGNTFIIGNNKMDENHLTFGEVLVYKTKEQ